MVDHLIQMLYLVQRIVRISREAAMDLKCNTRRCLGAAANATYPGTRSTSFCSSIIGCLQIFDLHVDITFKNEFEACEYVTTYGAVQWKR